MPVSTCYRSVEISECFGPFEFPARWKRVANESNATLWETPAVPRVHEVQTVTRMLLPPAGGYNPHRGAEQLLLADEVRSDKAEPTSKLGRRGRAPRRER